MGQPMILAERRPTAVVVEDHVLVRDSLVAVLRDRAHVDVVAVSADLKTLFVAAIDPTPDLLVLDLELGGTLADPAEVEQIVDAGTAVLIVSALANPRLVRAMLAAGVSGFVAKHDSLDSVLDAVSEVLAGGSWTTPALASVLAADPERPALSEQEERALVLYASGLKLDSVARRMGVAPSTAKQYIDRVREKYAAIGRDVRTKMELYRAAVGDGWLTPPDDVRTRR